MKTLSLHKRLYPRAAVQAAIDAFEELAVIRVTSEKTHLQVTFTQVDPDVDDVVVQEFANFALAEAIESRNVS